MKRFVLAVVVATAAATGPFVVSVSGLQETNPHASRFKQYKDRQNVRDGDPWALGPPGDVATAVVELGLGEVDRSGKTSVEYLRQYACAADTILVATPQNPRSEFTAEGTFLFTTFDLNVESVIRGNVSSGDQAKLIWPGGKLPHKGRTFVAIDRGYRLPSAGRKYLFFLKTIQAGEFETILQTAGYDVTESDAQSLGRGPLRERMKSYQLPAIVFGATGGCSR
jgi:hypothetical protein